MLPNKKQETRTWVEDEQMIRLKTLDCTVAHVKHDLVIEDGEDEDINRYVRVIEERNIKISSHFFICPRAS